MSIKKNIFYSISLNIINLIFPIVTVPYISRVLGVESIGLINFSTTYASYFSLLAALGINYYGVRELAKHKSDPEKTSRLFSELLVITSISTLIAVGLFLISIYSIPILRKDRAILLIAGISLYLTPVSIDWFFHAKENFKIITIRSLIIKVLAFASLFVFVRDRTDIVPYILISSLSTILSNIWNLFYARKHGLVIKLKNLEVKQHIKPMLVFLGSNISISIFVLLDVVMLGFLSTYEQVGFFTSPNKILMLIMMSFGAVNTALLPRLSANKHNNDHKANEQILQKTFDLTSFFIIPIAIGLSLISSRFVPLFFGKEFAGSIVPMQILSFKVIVVMINSFFALNILAALGYEKKFLVAVSITALLSFILNLFFIPSFGATGASAVSIVAESFEILLNVYFVYKLTTIRVSWKALINSAFLSLPFFAFYYFFNRVISNDIVFLVVFIGTSALCYFGSQLFIAKNYLLIQVYNAVTVKFKNENRLNF